MTRTRTALLAVGLLALTGCSTDTDDKPPGPQAAVREAARTYQEAVIDLDWAAACRMSTERLRHGTVAQCAANHPTPTPTDPTPSESPADEPTIEPPTYADGSTPDPIASPTSSGPERADTGPVRATDVVKVPATGDHPAGYGALITYTVKWPGKPATTTRRALRLVDVAGQWRVEQHESVNEAAPDVRAALTGR